jgi:hypothetical protein
MTVRHTINCNLLAKRILLGLNYEPLRSVTQCEFREKGDLWAEPWTDGELDQGLAEYVLATDLGVRVAMAIDGDSDSDIACSSSVERE